MISLLDRRTKLWAMLSAILGIVLHLLMELREEPDMRFVDILFELVDIIPMVLTSVGVAVLFVLSVRQREEQLTLLKDLETARLQGQKWRSDARSFIDGLGAAIDTQFSQWHLTDAETEVALLLLKGLSLKEIASVRTTSERTIRSQARSLYSKAGLTGRAALSAFFFGGSSCSDPN